jgi:hypothetical protein
MSKTTFKRLRLIGLCLLASGLSSLSEVVAQGPDWTFVPEKYEQNMMVTGIIYLNKTEVRDTSGILGAFLNEECRGMNKPVFYPAINKYVVSMMIYGNNNDENEYIRFRYYHAIDSTTNVLTDSIPFQSDAIIGNFANLYDWGEMPSGLKNAVSSDFLSILTTNPGQVSLVFKNPLSEAVMLKIITMNGTTCYKETYNPGTNVILLTNIPPGLYFITLNGLTIREITTLLIR